MTVGEARTRAAERINQLECSNHNRQVAEKQSKREQMAEVQARKKQRLEPERKFVKKDSKLTIAAPSNSPFKDTIALLAFASKDPDHPNFPVLNIYTVYGRVNGSQPQPLTAVLVDQKSYDECLEDDEWLTYKSNISRGLSGHGFVHFSASKYRALGLLEGVRDFYVCPRYNPDLVGLVRTRPEDKAHIEIIDSAAVAVSTA